jgi:hypothetical protein
VASPRLPWLIAGSIAVLSVSGLYIANPPPMTTGVVTQRSLMGLVRLIHYSTAIVVGTAVFSRICVTEPPVAGGMRRLRRARAASENGRHAHSRSLQRREDRACFQSSPSRLAEPEDGPDDESEGGTGTVHRRRGQPAGGGYSGEDAGGTWHREASDAHA